MVGITANVDVYSERYQCIMFEEEISWKASRLGNKRCVVVTVFQKAFLVTIGNMFQWQVIKIDEEHINNISHE